MTGRQDIVNGHLVGDLNCDGYSIIGLPSSTALLSIDKTIYVDGTNGTSGGQRGTTKAFQTLTQAIAVAQAGDVIQIRPGSYTTSSSYTISVANVTILGDGAKLLYNNNLGGISIQASGCKIYGLEIDANISAGTTDNGVIEVTGDNCVLERLYIHNSDRIGIRLLSSFNNARIIGCRLEYNNVGIKSAIGANVAGVVVSGCRITNNRNNGLNLSNSAAFIISKVTVVNNTLVDNDTAGNGREGLLLFGAIDDSVVTSNFVSGNTIGISLDHCRRGVCNSNTVKGASYAAIEMAGCQNLVCSSNYIDGRNDAGTSVGGYGISVSNNYATSNDTGPFVIANNLITNLVGQPAITINAANDVLITGNSSRDNATNKGGLAIKECFRVRVIGNSFVTTFSANGPIDLDAGGRTVGGKGLQDISLIANMFDNTGGAQIITISDSQAKGVNRIRIFANNVPQGGTFSAGYINDLASTTGLIVEGNIPQATAPNNQTGWHNVQSIERLSFDGLGTFSTTSPGISLAPSGNYKIGFDDVAGTKAYIRYHVDTAGAAWGHIFSAGNPASPTNLLSILGDGSIKAGTNTVETQNNKGAVSGYASLDGSGKVPAAQLPTLSAGTIASTTAVLKGDGSGNAVASTPTGTGDNVLATSPTLITPTVGVATATSVNKWVLTAPATAATITAGGDSLTYSMPEITTLIGFRHIPQNSKSEAYTTVLADSGKNIYHPVGDNNARTFTIDSNANVAYPIGTGMMFTNMAVANLTVAITSDTLTLLGAGTTGSRTVAQFGRLYVEKDTATSWIAVPVANVT